MAIEACALAYLAGLIDGDGSILIVRRQKKKTPGDRERRTGFIVHLKIGGETGHLSEMKQELGLGHVWVRKREGQRHLAEWTIAGKKACGILKQITPYLRLKKPQAELALSMRMARSRWTSTPELREHQEECWIEMKRLNHRFGRGKEARHGN